MNLAEFHPNPFAALPDEEKETIMVLFDVMRELKDVLLAENDLLDSGIPAALSGLNDLKSQLAEEFQLLSTEVMTEHTDELKADPLLGHRLVEAGLELRTLTQANMERLEGALNATRRRIESVMNAIHEHDQENRTYHKSGKGMAIGAQYVDYGVTYRI